MRKNQQLWRQVVTHIYTKGVQLHLALAAAVQQEKVRYDAVRTEPPKQNSSFFFGESGPSGKQNNMRRSDAWRTLTQLHSRQSLSNGY